MSVEPICLTFSPLRPKMPLKILNEPSSHENPLDTTDGLIVYGAPIAE